MKGKMKSITEIRQVLQRLRNQQKIRSIHQDTGTHRTIIREIYKAAVQYNWIDPNIPMPSDEEISTVLTLERKSSQEHVLSPYKEKISQWHQDKLTAVAIQSLLEELYQVSVDVQVVRRYIGKHCPDPIEPIMVRTAIPGKDADVDFADLGLFLDEKGEKIKLYLFSLRLRYSRKAFRLIVRDQTTATFCKGHSLAFEAFGGVVENIHPDCTKAAVIKATIENDMLNRSYQSCAEFYEFTISPCAPYTPEHKGGVEKDVDYSKRSCIARFRAYQKELGNEIPFASDFIKAFAKWEKEVDGPHIIRGVGRSPDELFEEEKHYLKPLPKERWELISWAQCKVRRDWRILWETNFYSIPYQFIGEEVQVKATLSIVRIYHQHKEIAMHERALGKGEYKRKAEHAPPYKEEVLQCSKEGLLELAERTGPHTKQYVQRMLSTPNIDKLAPARRLLHLAEDYGQDRLEKACKRGELFKLKSYREIKNILEQKLEERSQEEALVKEANKSQGSIRKCYKHSRPREEYRITESFEERLERRATPSKYGYDAYGVLKAAQADQMMDDLVQEEREAQAKGIPGPLRGKIPEPSEAWKIWNAQIENARKIKL